MNAAESSPQVKTPNRWGVSGEIVFEPSKQRRLVPVSTKDVQYSFIAIYIYTGNFHGVQFHGRPVFKGFLA